MMRAVRMRLLAALACWAVVGAGVLPPGHAAAQPAPVPGASASDAELDVLLVAHQWDPLGAALSRPDPQSLPRMMDWLHQRIDMGGGLLLPLLYARDLWGLGERQGATDPMHDMRVTAGLMTLYAYELILVDGSMCEDRSAPAHRLDQLFQVRASTLGFVRTLPSDLRTKLVDIAIVLEKKTAPLRGEDDLVCRDGLAQMKAGLTQGTQHEVAPLPGAVGHTVLVEPPVGWTPGMVPADVYLPMQDQARNRMRIELLKLTGLAQPEP